MIIGGGIVPSSDSVTGWAIRARFGPRSLAFAIAVAAVSGCASTATKRSSDLMLDGQSDFRSVLTQPFNDFNLVRTEIPEKLKDVRAAPYAAPASATCRDIDAEIAQLDQILGPDVASTDPNSREAIVSREAAERAARDAARSAATGWIPFRGFVRQISGAERAARALKEAVLAGIVRRAYLKGLRATVPCPIAPAH